MRSTKYFQQVREYVTGDRVRIVPPMPGSNLLTEPIVGMVGTVQGHSFRSGFVMYHVKMDGDSKDCGNWGLWPGEIELANNGIERAIRIIGEERNNEKED